LQYLTHMKEINFFSFGKLETLVLHFSDTKTSELLNLPNIKTLIFRDTSRFLIQRKREERKFMFGNFPISLEKIIFVCDIIIHKKAHESEIKNLDDTIIYLKDKIAKYAKLPLGCKVYYVDFDNKIHVISD
jgi:hypothetical protein